MVGSWFEKEAWGRFFGFSLTKRRERETGEDRVWQHATYKENWELKIISISFPSFRNAVTLASRNT